MKKIYWLMIIAFVFALSACTSSATLTPEIIIVTATPDLTIIEPTEETAPPAEDGNASTQWCADTHIVFFPGGPEGGGFAQVVYNGAFAAATDLGANIEFMWSEWNTDKMLSQFSEAMASNPDGIAIMGHPGDENFKPLVDEAQARGIVVTSLNTPLPVSQSTYAFNGFGYVGATNYTAGYALGAEAINRFGLQSGDQAFVWGLLSQPTRGERTQGVIDALEEAGLKVIYEEIDDATNADATAGIEIFKQVMSANPDIKLVVTDHGSLTRIMGTYLSAAGLGPNDLYGVGFDLSPETAEAIQAGWVDLVIDQQQWLQGYLSVLQICLTDNYAFTGLHIDTGAGFAHIGNIDLLADLIERQIR